MAIRAFTLSVLSCLAACSTYRFADGKLPDGSWNVPKLIADLEAAGKPLPLAEGFWLPLVWFESTVFEPSAPPLPPGYTLREWTSAGPLFCFGSRTTTIVDTTGASIEDEDEDWLLWGGLYHDVDGSIVTPSGKRWHDRWKVALVVGDDSSGYSTPQR